MIISGERFESGMGCVHRLKSALPRIPGQALVWSSGRVIVASLMFLAISAGLSNIAAAQDITRFLDQVPPGEIVPGGEAFGDPAGNPAQVPVTGPDGVVGHVILNTDWASSNGYSGKPINVVIGLDRDGTITGAKLVDHSEPIVLIGIPERKITAFINAYIGMEAAEMAKADASAAALPADIVSGATVTVIVIDDSIRRAAIRAAKALSLGGLSTVVDANAARFELKNEEPVARDWEGLIGDGSVRRLHLTTGDVNRAFEESGDAEAAARPIKGKSDKTFINLYTSVASIPTIGLSLLGKAEYANLEKTLEPGRHAILVMGKGGYSFKGSGYVRGGVFDRIQLIQGDHSIRFRDKDYKRIGDVQAAGAPNMKEVALFTIPKDAEFDPTRPFDLQLLVQRATGAIDKVFTTFTLRYSPPQKYLVRVESEAQQAASETTSDGQAGQGASQAVDQREEPLWKRIWRDRVLDISILLAAIGALTGIFFFQDWFSKRPKVLKYTRNIFLLFTVGWLGYYANAQLSVVNVLTFSNALISGFSWDYFLLDPLLFILWFAVAASLIFWGRGPFCGWLCPFGALQELLNKLAKLARVPQIAVPWDLHQRLWPVKYIAFLILFGVSLHALAQAERMSEVEPFKTAIILAFARDWPFVLYAVLLLVAGLFVERFFCRYLCPLGAALAIPGRLRVNDWLKRYQECGNPCQRCAKECPVEAIHPDGRINPNECIYCLNCQELYFDDHRCPVVKKKRLKRERRQALSSGKTPVPGNRSPSEAASKEPGKPARKGWVKGSTPAAVPTDPQ